jgi:hypothetical protein
MLSQSLPPFRSITTRIGFLGAGEEEEPDRPQPTASSAPPAPRPCRNLRRVKVVTVDS